jgi:hypothetical protein
LVEDGCANLANLDGSHVVGPLLNLNGNHKLLMMMIVLVLG